MKFAVYTLGCKVNTYESEYAIKEFIKNGFELVDFNDEENIADIYLINTCTVTNVSDQKSRKMIRQARKKNENAVIVVMGCFSQIEKNIEDIKEYCDVIIGNANKSKIVELTKEYIKNKNKIVDVKNINESSFDNMEISEFETRSRALIKIQDGCENFCSYCIIPYVRGKVRSKKKEEVISEAEKLVKNGYKEIVLTGIHTGHYGSDLEDVDFSDLLVSLNKIEGLERIRISSIEITELNNKFLNTLSKCEKIVNHLHIPLQAGSDNILKLMNRKYDLNYYYEKINKIRSIRKGIAITTDVIVGFPNEEEEDFLNTIEFVKKVGFAAGHVFPYSKREGTPASKMKNQLTNEEKHNRSRRLIEVFCKLEDNYYNSFIGKEELVIPEVYDNGYLIGHTSNYIKVKFKGCNKLLGKLVKVKLEQKKDKIIIGSIIE